MVDRYTHSAIAYGMALGIDREWTAGLDRGLLEPDLVLYLDLPTTCAAHGRAGYGQERYETLAFQGKVKKAFDFLKIAEVLPPQWQVVDGSSSIQAVHAAVLKPA